MDNAKWFWDAHKDVHLTQMKAPMVSLTDALAQEFRDGEGVPPHHDVRFAKEKSTDFTT